jgi:uncharacterized protein YjbI with pentapeptide repeats
VQANLNGTNLFAADLSKADLYQASFSDANLSAVKVTYASFGQNVGLPSQTWEELSKQGVVYYE